MMRRLNGLRYTISALTITMLLGLITQADIVSAASYSVLCDDGSADGKTIEFSLPGPVDSGLDVSKECQSRGYKGAFEKQSVSISGPCGKSSLFGIPAWYKGMTAEDCSFKPLTLKDDNGKDTGKTDVRNTAIKIGLNVLQAAMVIASYTALVFLIIGGYKYMLAAGSPDGTATAKKTIVNSIIGLVIALAAAGIINAVAGFIK